MRTGLIVGIDGHALDRRSRRVLAHPAVVGVILFSRNYRDSGQLIALCDEIRELREPRLLICVDQDGSVQEVNRFARELFLRGGVWEPGWFWVWWACSWSRPVPPTRFAWPGNGGSSIHHPSSSA